MKQVIEDRGTVREFYRASAFEAAEPGHVTISDGRTVLFGGQGTLNVNSWSPDSSRFAFVAYPTAT